MKKLKLTWPITVVCAFGSFISAMMIDSAFADEKHLNLLFWAMFVGLGLLTIGGLILASKKVRDDSI